MIFWQTVRMAALATALCAVGTQAFAQAQVVSGTAAVSYGTVRGTLEQAVEMMGRKNWQGAIEVYKTLVNAGTESEKGQARYGMALAFAQLGQEETALRSLEGTVADGTTPLGRAVGDLRGHLLLHLAEKGLHEDGAEGAKPWLAQYQRLTIMPDKGRYTRLEAATGNEGAKHPQRLQVGVLLPLSGPMQPVGESVLNGLMLAVTDGFGWPGVDVVLKPYDVAVGASAAAQAALDEGADVLVGPLLSKNVDEVAPLAQARNVPVLGLSSDRAAAKDGVWLASYLAADQGRAVADYARAQGLATVAGLIPSNPYGYELFDAFKEAARENGLEVVKTAFYNPQNVDVTANIRTLAEGMEKGGKAPFEALFIPAPAQSLALITSQLRYYDLDRGGLQLLGTALWQSPAVLSPASRELVGGVFAVPPENVDFKDRYVGAYGATPQPLALVGYDLGGLLGELSFERGRTGKALAELLVRDEGFYGRGGYLHFFDNGLNERGLDLIRVGQGAFDVLRAAPTMKPVAMPNTLLPEGMGRGGVFWR